MLKIYKDAVMMVGVVGRAARLIARYDSNLASQLRRAATSVPLNIAEGSGVQSGNRRQRYATALGSARETRACLEIAEALDYMGPLGAEDADRLDKIIATLVCVSR